MDKSISINTENDEALTTRGKLYAKEKTGTLAIQSYKQAIEINPKNADAWMNLGMEEANVGEIEEAMKCFEKVKAISGESAELWFRKGNAYNAV